MEMHSTLRRYQSKHGRAPTLPESSPPLSEAPKSKVKPPADAQQGELF
jgi:hypothetical protein